MKKIYSVFIGIIAGLVTVLILDQLFKGLIAYIAAGSGSYLSFSGIKLGVNFIAGNVNSFFLLSAVIISPFVFSLLLIEISLYWLSKTANDHLRSSLIVFQIINIGYLIFAVVLGIFSVLLNTTLSTDWSPLLNHPDLSYNQKLIFMFLVMFILLGYINILTKRIRKSIPVINRRK